MKLQKIDILLEVPKSDLVALGRDGAARYVVEKLRHGAEDKAHEVGGRVVVDRAPEIMIQEGSRLDVGGDWLLLAGRFWLEVPDTFDVSGQPGSVVTSRNRILLPG